MKTNLTTMTLMCIYMFKLAFNHDFVYYIHPRYITFSIIATCVCSFVVLKVWRHLQDIHFHEDERSGALSFFIICILIVAIITPAKGLTSTTATKRFNSNQTIIIKKEAKQTSPETLAVNDNKTEDSKTVKEPAIPDIKQVPVENKNSEKNNSDTKVAEQVTEQKKKESPFIILPRSNDSGDIFSNFVFNIQSTDDPYSFDGAEVELIGFVLIDSSDPLSEYHVSRFFITCCTADASPVGIAFEYQGSEYKNDDWIKIKGRLKIVKQDGVERPVIVPSSIERVGEPEFPYAYY